MWLNVLMTLCDEEPIRKKLLEYEIPNSHKVWCMVALGYLLGESAKRTDKKEDVVVYVD